MGWVNLGINNDSSENQHRDVWKGDAGGLSADGESEQCAGGALCTPRTLQLGLRLMF